MAKRMAVFCGIPTLLGITSFFGFYWIISHNLLEIPSYVAMLVSLSQTGRYLAYVVIIEGRPVIALYDRITDRSELLSQNYRGWLRNPRLSPDGRYLVFESACSSLFHVQF